VAPEGNIHWPPNPQILTAGKLTATQSGSSNFTVSEETGDAFNFGLLINEIGAYPPHAVTLGR
jgi:hypothetical protein